MVLQLGHFNIFLFAHHGEDVTNKFEEFLAYARSVEKDHTK